MDCDICGTTFGSHSKIHCATCARAALEPHRIELAKCLIGQSAVSKHVEAIVKGTGDKSSQHVSLKDSRGGLLVDRHECTKTVDMERAQAETLEVESRISMITDHAAMLRAEMDQTECEIQERKAAIAQRKSDIDSATYGLQARRANVVDKLQQNIKRMMYKSDKVHQETVEMRMYLCSMAAKLAGLKAPRRRTSDGVIKEVYCIGPGTALRVYDLRELNSPKFDNLTASLGAVANLLLRVSHYLGVRLPAEITAPHKDYPQHTILTPTSSYMGHNIPFPGTTPSHSSSNSPSASRTLESRPRPPLPRPRPLFIDRPLTHLAAEDPQAFSLFIEGASLLAYNVAWLCRTQGLNSDFEGWEDVCNMGRNLYRLLVAQGPRTLPKSQNPLDNDIAPKTTHASVPRGPVGFGQLSHATSHSFIETAENQAYLSGWKLSPTKIFDELKAFLLSEQQGAEWEVLDEKEWDDMENIIADEPVVVGGKKRVGPLDDGRSMVALVSEFARMRRSSANEREGTDSEREKGKNRSKGVSGWMKLKSRNEEGKGGSPAA
ncbi:hypothetical protein GQ43DRAFT_393486 [Delitschia confertaspora ATCC 74209]|uniref:Autophagy-related protein 14 n=1 Tax=Delitschia confertaspora ATCC 74209 TaxID=1513339 RepID=A0A9P4JR72_9PLEO|nr:hypothetical protein GQ43DRAFT_393486 [Delitschia confertaspora ATCC 74209]